MYDYEMFGVNLRSVHCAENLCVKVAYNLKFSQPWNDAANKANGVLGFIKRNFSFKNKDIINPLVRMSPTVDSRSVGS